MLAAPPTLQKPSSIRLLGRRIDRVTLASALTTIESLLKTQQPLQVVTANPLMFLAAVNDRELARAIDQAALVVPESSGIHWASHQVGTPLETFIPGIDLFQRLCELARDTQRSVYLLGAQPGVAEKAAVTLCAQFPGLTIAGTRDGYFKAGEDVAVVAQIQEAAPDFLFVGMSVPHQEKWIARNLHALGASLVMGVGGSFDVLSGNLQRAPRWMRECGVEWLYRTIQEPWRLKRIVHLLVFVWKVLRGNV